MSESPASSGTSTRQGKRKGWSPMDRERHCPSIMRQRPSTRSLGGGAGSLQVEPAGGLLLRDHRAWALRPGPTRGLGEIYQSAKCKVMRQEVRPGRGQVLRPWSLSLHRDGLQI